MTFDHFIAYTCLWVIGCVSSMAGIGGGALLLPILIFLLDIPILLAVPITIACIMGNSFVRATILFPKKHRVADTSMIDYTILLLLVPADAIGSLVGALLSQIVEAEPLLWIISVITFFTALKTLKKGHKLRKQQLETGDTETIHIDGISLQVLPINSIDTGIYVANGYAMKGLFAFEFIFIILSICRVYVPEMDVTIIFLIILASLFTLVVGFRMNIEPSVSPNMKWEKKVALGIIAAGMCIGTVSTLVGVGGGMFVAPLLLHSGVTPEVMAATNSMSTFFSSFATLLQFIVLGRVEPEISTFCMLLSATAASIGLRIVAKSTWTIVVALGVLIGVASILMIVKASLEID